jgi:hypothetical protein
MNYTLIIYEHTETKIISNHLRDFVFLINFLIPLYTKTGTMQVGQPILPSEQQHKQSHSPFE